MNDAEIREVYNQISDYHKKYLEEKGVKLPALIRSGRYTKDALTLVYLCRDFPNTHIVSKSDLTTFIRRFYPDTNDVQQARHLGAQKGWYILSGTRGDNSSMMLKPNEYQLISLTESYPGFTGERRNFIEGDAYFESLKAQYDYCCATCGSREGAPHRYWKRTITVLQKGHMDPSKPLEAGNIIPQCEKCNRADRNNWIYDAKGRVIAIANERVIDRCDKAMRKRIYERLKLEFES